MRVALDVLRIRVALKLTQFFITSNDNKSNDNDSDRNRVHNSLTVSLIFSCPFQFHEPPPHQKFNTLLVFAARHIERCHRSLSYLELSTSPMHPNAIFKKVL